jgi:putative transposase
MPNHVHLIAVPKTETSLARALGEAHRRYTRRINFRENWRGHLWQERFASFPMDESHLLAAVRYVEMNPVVAGWLPTPLNIGGAAPPLISKARRISLPGRPLSKI